MNIFDFRDRLVGDYANYVRSFIAIQDDRIQERVKTELAEGLLWPEPSIGLNPTFAKVIGSTNWCSPPFSESLNCLSIRTQGDSQRKRTSHVTH
jgi:hypothetical protein